ILITNGEIEKARESNELFLKTNPKHSTGLHHRSLIFLAEGKTDDAVESLQDAMDAITGNEIPISLANAFRMVGVALFGEGKTMAGRAHLKYAMVLKNESDPEIGRMLQESLAAPSTPLVLKQEFPLAPVPEDVEWEKRYVNTFRALDRGQFRKGLKFLNKIDSEFPNLPIVVRSIAIVNSYLGRIEDQVEAWRRYSQLEGVSVLEGAEAEAIAQLFDTKALAATVSIVRNTYEIDGVDLVSELALSNSRLANSEPMPADPFDEGPAPRMNFLILDRDAVTDAAELTLENVPTVIGEFLVFGKQTDRDARLEVITAEDSRLEQVTSFITELFGESISGDVVKRSIGESTAMSELLEWRWHLPEGVTRKQHSEMVEAHREHLMVDEWPKLEFKILGDRSAEDAAGDPEVELPLRALVLMLENASQGQGFTEGLGQKMREKLGLSEYERIVPEGDLLTGSPILQQYLDFSGLTEAQLMSVQNSAMGVGNVRVLKQLVSEVLSRPDMESMPRDVSYSMMAHFAEDDNEALEFLEKAKEEARKSGRSVGIYFVQEFEFKLMRGMTDQITELLQTIQMNHLNEPEVEYQLVRVLDRFGIGPDRGPIRGAPETAPADPGQGGIWTPDQGGPQPEPAAESGSDGANEESSGLWIPE
ncbi:MAG: hypothetical protein HN566_12600, partial [Polaribacter sp.]|nr:hypothetical protein [Polaribacter sp.]